MESAHHSGFDSAFFNPLHLVWVPVYAVDGDPAPCDPSGMCETSLRLNQVVRSIRQRKGMSQEGFAHSIGLHRTFMGSTCVRAIC